jgi:hypothetical protein
MYFKIGNKGSVSGIRSTYGWNSGISEVANFDLIFPHHFQRNHFRTITGYRKRLSEKDLVI